MFCPLFNGANVLDPKGASSVANNTQQIKVHDLLYTMEIQ